MMANARSRRIQAMNERIFMLLVKMFVVALALFTLAIVADMVLHLGWGFNGSDLKTIGIIGVILVGIFAWSRVVKRVLDHLNL